ncbi:MAG TPA: lytic transglycosylase domain-containing protein [Thiobacillus sp.]|nr:lytic transglycosylase domain-containing protein [Thiobacillus sp.]
MNELERLAREAATKHGLDPRLICALCKVESSWIPWAVRHEPNYKWLYGKLEDGYPGTVDTELAMQRTSWGLLQIMGAVARERGFRGWLTELCDPSVNLEWGCKHLRWMLDHNNAYGLPDFRIKPEDLAAAWNGGTRIVIDGKYKNQSYVDLVVKAMVNYQ